MCLDLNNQDRIDLAVCDYENLLHFPRKFPGVYRQYCGPLCIDIGDYLRQFGAIGGSESYPVGRKQTRKTFPAPFQNFFLFFRYQIVISADDKSRIVCSGQGFDAADEMSFDAEQYRLRLGRCRMIRR